MIISLPVQTAVCPSRAVGAFVVLVSIQLSMLVLLVSVFFSGFFLRITAFWPPIQFVSYALPVTYGISSLQVIMLRGGAPAPQLLIALLMLGTFFGLLSFILFNREFRKG